MDMYREMCILAFRQFMGDRADSLLRFMGERFNDHSRRLDVALRNANDRAWRSLEVALAGPSWWSACKSMLTPRDQQGLQKNIQVFLASLPAAELPGDAEAFRKKALADLRGARRVGLVPGTDLSSEELAGEVRTFARYSDPTRVIEMDRQAIEGMAVVLRKEGYTDLAVYINLRPGQGQPLLVQAVRYFFRREVENDERLANSLMVDRLEGLDTQLGAGLGGLHDALKEHGSRVEELLTSVAGLVAETSKDVKATMEIASGTRDDVQALRTQLDQQSDQIRQLMQMLQQQLDQRAPTPAPVAPVPAPPAPVAPIPAPVVLPTPLAAESAGPAAAEWGQVRQLLARFQKLTPEEQRRRPDLARVAGQLTMATQGYETTRRTIQTLQHTQEGSDPLPVYPSDAPIMDALPADDPPAPPSRRPRLISGIFSTSQPPATPTEPQPPAAEQPPADALPAKPKKRRLLSPLFDPEQGKGEGT